MLNTAYRKEQRIASVRSRQKGMTPVEERRTPVTEMSAALRNALVEELVAEGTIRSPGIERAFRTVPRHLFTPGVTPAGAYAQAVVVTKRDTDGVVISSVSEPRVQATMLEQAALRPGMRCLEIGSGGYNAALMADLVGDTGRVTSLDIDPEVVGRARGCLAAAGLPGIDVRCGDGEDGWARGAPYDRIVVTVGTWDLPPAWADQLAPGGTITVPLLIRGLTRVVTFAGDGGALAGRAGGTCAFVAMQGTGAHAGQVVALPGTQLRLRSDASVDAALLADALGGERVEAWSGVGVGRDERYDSLHLWLATALDGFCVLLVAPNTLTSTAVVAGGSFCYLALRVLDEAAVEFGVHAFGPAAAELAAAVVQQVRVWDARHRRGPGPLITAHPAGTPDDRIAADRVVTARHVRLGLRWDAGSPGSP
jgi:protein-L-isoaspartate(D-aspartate) O-methyltransferase